MAIQNLPRLSSLTGGEFLALYSPGLGTDAAATLAVLLAWLQDQLTTGTSQTTQYAAPPAGTFGITITPAVDGGNVWLLLTPGGLITTGTITLPALPVDGQQVSCTCTGSVSTLVVVGNGASVYGAPALLSAGAFFTMRYDAVYRTWYRVA